MAATSPRSSSAPGRSNFRSGAELSDYLAQHGVPGIEGVDTRMLTRRVRDHGEQRVLITRDMTASDADLRERMAAGSERRDASTA